MLRAQGKVFCFQSVHVNPGEGRPFFVFVLPPFRKRETKFQVCWNGFCGLLYLAVCNTVLSANFFLLLLDLGSPSISLVLQPEVKSRMASSQCLPSCDVTELAERAKQSSPQIGLKYLSFISFIARIFKFFKSKAYVFVSRDLNY